MSESLETRARVEKGAVSVRAVRNDTRDTSAIDRTTKVKRIFNHYSIFAFSLTYGLMWEGMCTNLYFALYNGGPQVFVWSVLIAWIGALAQGASLAEMASIQPICGAQYHWTWAFAPPRYRRFLAWLQGWLTWFGFVSLLCGVVNVNASVLLSLASFCYPEYVIKDWHVLLTIYALITTQAALNIFAFKLIPKIEMVAGVAHVVMFVVFLCIFCTMGEKHTAAYVWTHFEVSSGWENDFVAWNIGMLSAVWSFTGFDGPVHMCEETLEARNAVPRAMFWSLALNGLLAWAMTIAILFSSGSLQDALESDWPILTILQHTTGSAKVTAILIALVVAAFYCCSLALTATVSRLTWSWARDGGLHPWFSQVSETFGVPIQAIVLPTMLVMLLALLVLGSETAVGAIIALSSLAILCSYFIAISAMLWTRYAGSRELGRWNLGRMGAYVNVFALIYTSWVIIFLPWPSTMPVTAINMNYAGPMMAFCLAFAVITWVFWARTSWAGLSIKVIEDVLASER